MLWSESDPGLSLCHCRKHTFCSCRPAGAVLFSSGVCGRQVCLSNRLSVVAALSVLHNAAICPGNASSQKARGVQRGGQPGPGLVLNTSGQLRPVESSGSHYLLLQLEVSEWLHLEGIRKKAPRRKQPEGHAIGLPEPFENGAGISLRRTRIQWQLLYRSARKTCVTRRSGGQAMRLPGPIAYGTEANVCMRSKPGSHSAEPRVPTYVILRAAISVHLQPMPIIYILRCPSCVSAVMHYGGAAFHVLTCLPCRKRAVREGERSPPRRVARRVTIGVSPATPLPGLGEPAPEGLPVRTSDAGKCA